MEHLQVNVCGLTGSGKTVVTQLIADLLISKGFNVNVPYNSDIVKYPHTSNEMKDAIATTSKRSDVLIREVQVNIDGRYQNEQRTN